jgi:outer membrane protein assembly factor BamA
MRKLTSIAIILLAGFLASCTYQLPRKYLPYPVSTDSFSDPAKTVVIPLPVIASSPNEGITYGGLVAFLLHNAKDEVSTLIVPQLNYNQYFGVTTTLYGAFYPTPEKSLRVNLSKATTINEEFRFRYQDRKFLTDKLELNLSAFDYVDGSARFFGFQSNSSQQNETNYSYQEIGFNFSVGYRFGHHMEVVLGDRYKRVNIEKGAVPSVSFITDIFQARSIPGVDGYDVHAQKLSLVHNTLDSMDMPTSGSYLRFSIDNSAKLLGSSALYQGYEAEGKWFFPLREAKYISVVRLAGNQTVGNRVPFLERSILGGETTLRGYGQNRFIDKSYLLLNLEERIRLFRWDIFNVRADWELAPFIDLGSVMSSLIEAKSSSFEFNPGVGLRTVVRPNIVGRIDVGFGKDGPAVFVGLGYPF